MYGPSSYIRLTYQFHPQCGWQQHVGLVYGKKPYRMIFFQCWILKSSWRSTTVPRVVWVRRLPIRWLDWWVPVRIHTPVVLHTAPPTPVRSSVWDPLLFCLEPQGVRCLCTTTYVQQESWWLTPFCFPDHNFLCNIAIWSGWLHVIMCLRNMGLCSPWAWLVIMMLGAAFSQPMKIDFEGGCAVLPFLQFVCMLWSGPPPPQSAPAPNHRLSIKPRKRKMLLILQLLPHRFDEGKATFQSIKTC
jgi:hypothetical protein